VSGDATGLARLDRVPSVRQPETRVPRRADTPGAIAVSSDESPATGGAARELPSLLLPADVVDELRLALVNDLRSAAEDLARAAVDIGLANGNGATARTTIAAQTKAICQQRELHAAIGLPGDPPKEVRLARPEHLDLAVKLLVEYRGAQAARVTQSQDLSDEDRGRATGSVRLLTDFLRQAIPGWPETV
jgi:hypothetical protein